MAACPAGAIHRDDNYGIVYINQFECVGCRNCVLACPWSMPRFDEDLGMVVKCDLCGGEPECVRVCPTNATKMFSEEEAVKIISSMLGDLHGY